MTDDRELVVSKLIDGPPSVVFQALSKIEHLSRWWGPNGFTTTTHSFEFRPGGVWDFTMHGPDGTDYPNWIEWIEIAPPGRIELRHGSSPDDSEAFLSVISIRPRGRGSEVELRSIFPTKAARDHAVDEFGAIEGGQQTLGRLQAHVEKGPET